MPYRVAAPLELVDGGVRTGNPTISQPFPARNSAAVRYRAGFPGNSNTNTALVQRTLGQRARMRHSLFLVLYLSFLLSACQIPRDPENTTAKVRGSVLQVGVLSDGLPDSDRGVIETLARRLDARPEYHTGSAHRLLEGLKVGELHVLTGSIPGSTPFSRHVGKSNSYGPPIPTAQGAKPRVLLIRRGENQFLMELNRSVQAVKRSGG